MKDLMGCVVFAAPAGWALGILAAAAAGAEPPAIEPSGPVRLGVAGLVHGHVYGFLQNAVNREDVEVVGLWDRSLELVNRHGRHHHKLPPETLFTDLGQMLDERRPQAVAVFTNTFDHLKVVRACARRGVDVMLEKPPAVDLEQARAMAEAARTGGIHVLVNYETTWYANTQAAFDVVKRQGSIGHIRKIVVRAGHAGPKEIGMPAEFTDWLTDPQRNGGGALYDFGCYGADLVTWLMDGRPPLSVTAVTQRLKSDAAYSKVDDEATIVLTYPQAQAIIQASWNWPYSRKDMEIYGETGCFVTIGNDGYRIRVLDADKEVRAEAPRPPGHDPVSYLVAVVRGQTEPAGLSCLELNLVVAEILDAARRSANSGRTVRLAVSPETGPAEGEYEQ